MQQNEPRHITLAREAVLAGMTRESLVTALLGRVRRDAGYLAYRKACNRRTSYDEQVQHDMRALALAAVLLDDEILTTVTSQTEQDAVPE